MSPMLRALKRLRITVAAAVAVVATLSIQTSAADRHFIWKATGAQGSIFLVGSVHVLTAAYYPLPAVFNNAFEQCDLLVEEIDLADMLKPAAQMQLLSRGRLPTGTTLDSVLSPTTLAAVKKTVADLGLPFEPLRQFKPWMLELTLQAMVLQKAGFDNDFGVDKHFYDIALATKRSVQGLETVDEQISALDSTPPDVQDRTLAKTLDEMSAVEKTVTEAADLWRAGDAEGLVALMLPDLKAEPKVYEELLVKRNRAWMPKLETLLRRPRPAFVVVGAAHLIGPDGLVAMLRGKGYKVEQQ
jgi:uncharacterized protein YbaP (TraB family)